MPYSVIREKVDQNCSSLEISIFLRNFFFDRIGPEEMILQFVQYLSFYLVDPYKLFPELFHSRQYEKKIAEKIFSVEN